MNLLLTNDDGLKAKGLQLLKNELKKNYNVFVVAPDEEKSGASQSITFKEPVKIIEHQVNEYSVTGTPADCVNIALNGLFKNKIDLVISGINNGSNIGKDTFYSGTVAAAREAYSQDIPAIAFSLVRNENISFAEDYSVIAKKITDWIIKNDIKGLINVNFPEIKPFPLPDIVFTKLGKDNYSYGILPAKEMKDNSYYWIDYRRHNTNDKETDVYAIHKDKISICPLNINSFDEKTYNEISKMDINL